MCNHHHEPEAVDAETKAIHQRRVVVQALAAGAAITVTGSGLSGCSTNPETGEKQFVGLASAGQLNSMAAASWAELKQKTPTSNDPRYANRLKNIGSRISRGANKSNEQWDYAVFDSEAKNAFVLPGNRVGFYKGMMDFAGNDDQIAAVMGHEVGHVTGRHARERVSQQMAGQLAIGAGTIIGGTQMSKRCNKYADQRQRTACQRSASRNTQLLSQALGLGFTFGVILPYSRKHESQSDLLGAKYMHKSGYNAMESVKLWEKMAEANTNRQPEFMSTHPDPSRRARDLHNYIRYQESLGSQGWQSIRMPKKA